MVIHKIAQNHVGTERVRTDQVGPDRVNSVEQLSVPKLIALHLVPGALVTATFVVLAPLVKAAGLPPIAALLAATYVGGWNQARLLGRRIDKHTAPLTRRSS